MEKVKKALEMRAKEKIFCMEKTKYIPSFQSIVFFVIVKKYPSLTSRYVLFHLKTKQNKKVKMYRIFISRNGAV